MSSLPARDDDACESEDDHSCRALRDPRRAARLLATPSEWPTHLCTTTGFSSTMRWAHGRESDLFHTITRPNAYGLRGYAGDDVSDAILRHIGRWAERWPLPIGTAAFRQFAWDTGWRDGPGYGDELLPKHFRGHEHAALIMTVGGVTFFGLAEPINDDTPGDALCYESWPDEGEYYVLSEGWIDISDPKPNRQSIKDIANGLHRLWSDIAGVPVGRGRPSGTGRTDVQDVFSAYRRYLSEKGKRPAQDVLAECMHISRRTLQRAMKDTDTWRECQRLPIPSARPPRTY